MSSQINSESLISLIAEYKVSSVLNNDRKVYGKKFLFDGKDETCWNSDQGIPQWIHLTFSKPVRISQLSIQFQGGFAGKDCLLESLSDNGDTSTVDDQDKSYRFTPSDSNSVQQFNLPTIPPPSQEYKLWFKSTTDFYGRIIIYYLDILGYHD